MGSETSSVVGVKDSAKSQSSSAAGAAIHGAATDGQAARVDSRAAAAAFSPAHSVGFTLSSLGYAVARRFRAELAPLELEPREFALLRAVAPAEGASQQALAERLQIPPSRMVAFVDALEARGLLERRANPDDRRVRALYLTDEGRKLLAAAFTLAAELEAQLCGDLSERERERLLDSLQRVGARLDVGPGVHSAHSD